MKSSGTTGTQVLKRKSKFLPRLFISIGILTVVSVIVFFAAKNILTSINSKPTVSQLYFQWNNKNYIAVNEVANNILKEKPYQSTALAYKGYASFYLAVSQTEPAIAQSYIDESINSLRLALKMASEKIKPQISYMLGKAYFHKNTLSSFHYYSDLAVYYLLQARSSGFNASDIPEYLGLSYANLSMTEESIASFSEALITNENDILLLAIAEQYINNSQPGVAKQYLYRLRSTSKDDSTVLKACYLLGTIYTDEQNYQDALTEFQTILQKDPNNADAYYGIGVIYENQGDMAKARAEWRKALKAQINHPGALKKLG